MTAPFHHIKSLRNKTRRKRIQSIYIHTKCVAKTDNMSSSISPALFFVETFYVRRHCKCHLISKSSPLIRLKSGPVLLINKSLESLIAGARIRGGGFSRLRPEPDSRNGCSTAKGPTMREDHDNRDKDGGRVKPRSCSRANGEDPLMCDLRAQVN